MFVFSRIFVILSIHEHFILNSLFGAFLQKTGSYEFRLKTLSEANGYKFLQFCPLPPETDKLPCRLLFVEKIFPVNYFHEHVTLKH